MTTKKCCRCKEEKDISLFGKNAFHDDNLHHYCKTCQNIIASEYRKNNPEKIHSSIKKYRNNPRNKYKIYASTTLNDHKRNNFIVNITINELEKLAINTNFCIYCGIELNYNRGYKFMALDNSPSLDRINNENEMNMENVQIICHKCNAIKHDMTHLEFIKYCKHIFDKFGNELGVIA